MKNKAAKKIFCLSMAAMLGIASPAAVMAAEEVKTEETEPAAENGEEKASEEEAKTDEERVPEDVTVTLKTGDVVLKNETKRFFGTAEYKRAESRVVENAELASQGGEQVAQTWDLVLTEEEGTVHTFQDVRADKWKEPVLTEEFGILYVTYQDEENEEQEALEDAEEKNLETPVTVYATTEVNIRETPDTASQSLKVTKAGEEWTAIAVLPGWVKVEGNGVTGYVHHEYVTEDKEQIEALKTAEPTAAVQQPAEQEPQSSYQEPVNDYQEPQYNNTPAQPAEQEPAQPQQPSEPSEPTEPDTPDDSGEVTELSREDIPNEAGDGHGVYEITYSDGSVVYEEY